MKKFAILILAVPLCLGLCSCKGGFFGSDSAPVVLPTEPPYTVPAVQSSTTPAPYSSQPAQAPEIEGNFQPDMSMSGGNNTSNPLWAP